MPKEELLYFHRPVVGKSITWEPELKIGNGEYEIYHLYARINTTGGQLFKTIIYYARERGDGTFDLQTFFYGYSNYWHPAIVNGKHPIQGKGKVYFYMQPQNNGVFDADVYATYRRVK